ncbi:MAG TPA: DUF3095 domain-containing protein [Beijerinckiaceae bacterium]|jgi:hypothetical protein
MPAGDVQSLGPPDGFYERLPVIASFARLNDPAVYAPLPDGWVLGLSDIVRSTAAIAAGRYKVVNTAAAAVIAALANGLAQKDFPFVFGGDGAGFALPPGEAERGRDALAAVAAWARDDLDLAMRAALVPVAAVRAQGLDVRVARFAASPDVSYAMFAGGGLAWAEERMKAGDFSLEPAPPGTRPDLTGLSCRFDEIKAGRGVILSLIAVPKRGGDPAAFDALVGAVLGLAEGGEAARPVPDGGPPPRWPPSGFDLEVRASPLHRRSPLAARLWIGARTLAAHAIFKTGMRVGGFDPARYNRQLVENTDFRKFDDGLRMTLDCTPAFADRLEALFASAEAAGVARCGTHRQAAALMTCFVPSATRSDHVHFVDGAAGGYATAARAVKLAG